MFISKTHSALNEPVTPGVHHWKIYTSGDDCKAIKWKKIPPVTYSLQVGKG
jgi:hypothetical protein